ncbi:hypothetical protein BH20ACT5_BH20ACT5_23410 [soil metagenome]
MSNRNKGFLAGFLIVTLLLAGVVSNFASRSPDGLEKVSEDTGFGESASEHGLGDSPFADYGSSFIDQPFLSTLVAGVLGVVFTLLIGLGVFLLVRRRSGAPRQDAPRQDAEGARRR